MASLDALPRADVLSMDLVTLPMTGPAPPPAPFLRRAEPVLDVRPGRSVSHDKCGCSTVEMWRGGFRFEHICCRLFRLAVPH